MRVALSRFGGFALLLSAFLFGTDAISTAPAGAVPGSTTRVSVPNLADQGTLGPEANAASQSASISADGRYVAFESEATNLVLGDTNGVRDIFVHDRLTGATERISVDGAGGEANGPSFDPDISGDGNVVAFSSRASNLVPGDTFGFEDIFIRNRTAGTTQQVSVSIYGQAIGASLYPSANQDGSVIAFSSNADGLVPGGYDGGDWDVYVRDVGSGTTTAILGVSRSDNPTVSDNGNFIVLESSNALKLHDRQLGTTVAVGGDSFLEWDVSDDGRYVVYDTFATGAPGDHGANLDIYLRDRQLAVWELISVKPDGTSSGLLSASPSLSAAGRFVAFQSGPEGTATALGLVPGDTNNATDAFVRDRLMMVTRRVSVDSAGNQVSLGGGKPEISSDGHFVAFLSTAPDLVAGDTNGVSDVFLNDLQGDFDGDGYIDTDDNCWSLSNPAQANSDGDPAGDACDNCPSVTNATQWNNDEDALGNECDNCPSNANPGQENNVHPATPKGDHCEDPDFDTIKDLFDNCPDTSNPAQTNTDGDSMGDACDSDDDNDLVADVDESPCGADPLNVTPPLSRPERVDLPGDDDGDTQIDEALPGGAEAFDCDGDGYAGTAEAHVFSDTNVRDQDPCGTAAWPSDFVAGGIPDSTDRVNVLDIISFIAPVRRLNTSPPEAEYADRWDLVPGAGLFPKVINVTDLTALIASSSGNPPMLGGVRAFNGPPCHWPP